MGHGESQLSENVLPLFGGSAAPPAAHGLPKPLPGYVVDHRKRLRQRFMDCGPAALPDYEMLELVLFRAVSRADVKPLAHALLSAFGDFGAVISAPLERLMEVRGVGAAVVTELKVVEAAAQRLARARVMRRNVISSWDALVGYCRTIMAHRDTEHFRVLYLDNRNALIADEETGRGTVNHVPVYPREVAKRALELAASAVILVHNHPSGDPTPSEGDIAMTRRVEAALSALDITLHDHLVVGRSSEASFRERGLI